MKRILLALLFLAFAAPLQAADIYYANAAVGSHDGTSCGNAYSYHDAVHGTDGSQTAPWVPGNTLHVCGTWTGAAGDQAINVNGNGSAGNPITIKFETGAVLTAPYWGGIGGAITMGGGASWIVIDGGTNGVIQNTANGTGLMYQVNSHGIYGQNGLSNIIIKNLTISNICVHTTADTVGVNCSTSGNDAAGIRLHGAKTNVVVTQNTIHDASVGIVDDGASGDTGVVIDHNTITHCNWGINLNDGTATGTQVTNNDISCVVGGICNWDTGVSNVFHHNGIMFDPCAGIAFPAPCTDSWVGTVIANNYIHDVNPSTSLLFVDNPDYPDSATGTVTYNNVGFTTPGQDGAHDGMIGFTKGNLVANNTMVGAGMGGTDGSGVGGVHPNPTIKNNITTTLVYGEIVTSTATGVVSDYNDFYSLTGMNYHGTIYGTLAAWVAATLLDQHSISTNPNLTAAFVPNMGSPVIGAGQNLTNLGIPGLNVGAPQTFGAGGTCGTGCTPRPGGSTPWDMGAYPYVSGGTPGPWTLTIQSSNPPSGVAITATADANGKTSGNTPTSFVYANGANPVITAPATSGGNALSSIVGCTTPASPSCTQTSIAGSGTIAFNYTVVPPVTLTVHSTNPASAVSIVCTAGTASTPFTQSYSVGAALTCTAPPTVGLNTFTSWNCPGGSVSGNSCTFASIPADATITANYGGGVGPGCQQSGSSFSSLSIANQSGTFTVTYSDTPSQNNMDGVLGFSMGAAAAYSDLAVITRFNASGTIDAWNQAAGNYAAVNSFPYSGSVIYHFRLVVNTSAGTYNAFVTAPGGSETQIASAYTFRTGAEPLNNWAVTSEVGFHTGCGVSIQNPTAGPPGAPVLIISGD